MVASKNLPHSKGAWSALGIPLFLIFAFENFAGSCSTAAAGEVTVRLLSRTTQNGETGGAWSDFPTSSKAVSADGRFVLLKSWSPNLVIGQVDPGKKDDIFLYDRQDEEMLLVSHSTISTTTAANGASIDAAISADGAYVVFASYASDLVPGLTKSTTGLDLFLYERATGTITLVTQAFGAPLTGAGGSGASISADGRYVSFQSYSTNFGFTDLNGVPDIFLYDRVLDSITLVSRTSGSSTTTANGQSTSAQISADGSSVVFSSSATDLGFTDSNGKDDLFLFDRVADSLQLVSRSGASATTTANGLSESPSISDDGLFVSFESQATNIGFTDSSSASDIFLFSKASGTLQLVSRSGASSTTAGSSWSTNAVLSGDGNFVAFQSLSTNFGFTDSNSKSDIFLFDRTSGTLQLVSHTELSLTTSANGNSYTPSICRNGDYVAFASSGADYGFTDSNLNLDVFLFERATGTNVLASHTGQSPTVTACQSSGTPILSGDGSMVAFASSANDFGFIDENGNNDIFCYEQASGDVQLLSRNNGNSSASGRGVVSGITGDRRRITTDGRYCLIQSYSGGLIAGQTGAAGPNIFVYDRILDSYSLVSRTHDSALTAAGGGFGQDISDDGAYVAFQTTSSQIISGFIDNNLTLDCDIYLYNRASGTNVLVSHSTVSSQSSGNKSSTSPKISADGEYVAFSSLATNFGFTDTNNASDVFLYERSTGNIQLVSHSSGSQTTTANGDSTGACSSNDGRYVAYSSTARDLGFTDSNGAYDAILFDRVTGTNYLVSRSSSSATVAGNSNSGATSINGDGSWVLFTSNATDLGFTDSNGTTDVFLFERATGNVSLVSRSAASASTTANGQSVSPVMNADGTYVAFMSLATDFGFTDANGQYDVLLLDRTTGILQLVSHTAGSVTATSDGRSDYMSISAAGKIVTFRSSASDLGFSSSSPFTSIYSFDRDTQALGLVSRSLASSDVAGDSSSDEDYVSGNGHYVLFRSQASDLVPDDLNAIEDVFLASLGTAPAVNLGNLVFSDLDNDGLFEPGNGETGIDGVVLDLYRDDGLTPGVYDANDSLIETTVSAGGGAYEFTGLIEGVYLVRISAVSFASGNALWSYVTSTGNDPAPDPDDDVDGDDNGLSGGSGGVVSKAITLIAGAEPDAGSDGDGTDGNLTVDFGFVPVPIASDASIVTDEEVALSDTLSASHPLSAALTFQIVTNGAKGSAVLTDASTGEFVYTPDLDENGQDTFTFQVDDGVSTSNVATVTIDITPMPELTINALSVDPDGTLNAKPTELVATLSDDLYAGSVPLMKLSEKREP